MSDREDNQAGVPDLSVVIVNWNTRADLNACLRFLLQDTAIRIETIVVDNASADGSADMVRAEFPHVQLVENKDNLGFAKAANQGIALSQGRYVFLLNPDTEVKPGALPALVRFGDDNSDAGIFGPRILNSDGSLQYSCRRFPTLAAGLFRNTILGRFFPRNTYLMDYLMASWDHSETRDVDWVSGAAMMIRRELLDDVGRLDERFYMYCEDVDFAYRARQRDWRVAYYPGAVVVHARARSSDKDPNRMIVEFHKSMYRFFRKHYARKSSVFSRLVVPVGLFARAAFFISRNDYYHLRHLLAMKLRRSRKACPHDRTADEEPCARGKCSETKGNRDS